MKKIAVAMSGGVDSSAVAALLKEQGQEIVGLSMQLWNQRRINVGPDGEPLPSKCCSLDDLYDARSVANHLEIPFYVLNFEEDFEEHVVAPFVSSYLNGYTPNPCVACNSRLKFSTLVKLADNIGAEKVATGHYARVQFNGDTNRYELLKGLDQNKDQSYFLFELTQDQLAKAVFPLGTMSKTEVREIARRNNLSTAEKSESQEICFVPDGNYGQFIDRYIKDVGGEVKANPQSLSSTQLVQLNLRRNLSGPGEIITTEGTVVGQHQGTHHYTIGQRRGLGINSPNGLPLYVISIDINNNQVVVGTADQLPGLTLTAGRINWISIQKLEKPIRVKARIRYRHSEASAVVTPLENGEVNVFFDEPQKAITPGQAIVFYENDLVVGGGWIIR